MKGLQQAAASKKRKIIFDSKYHDTPLSLKKT